MIDYDKSEWFGTTRIVGSVLPRSIPFACISVVITVLMIIHSEIAEQDTTEDTVLGLVGEGVIYSLVVNPYVHQVSLLSISFVIAFRVNLAYNRYWEGLTMVHNMRQKYIDSITMLIAFDDPSTAGKPPPNVMGFKCIIGHLFSLLHAVAMLEIKSCWDVRCLVTEQARQVSVEISYISAIFPWLRACLISGEDRYKYIQMQVLGGMESHEYDQLQGIGDAGWVEFTQLRVVRLICDRISNGGLQMPPPIVSRIFQEISNGTLMCATAQKIAQNPFPFPFYDLMRLIKYYFIFTCPLVIVSFTSHVMVAVVCAFLSSLFFVAINEVAEELEDPFGEDANDLPLMAMHAEFNETLYKMIFMPRLASDSMSSKRGRQFQEVIQREMTQHYGEQAQSNPTFKAFVEKMLHSEQYPSAPSSPKPVRKSQLILQVAKEMKAKEEAEQQAAEQTQAAGPAAVKASPADEQRRATAPAPPPSAAAAKAGEVRL